MKNRDALNTIRTLSSASIAYPPTFPFDADPDPTFHFDVDPDPGFQIKDQSLEKVLTYSYSVRTFWLVVRKLKPY
jgi:hypothetical protein